MTLRGKIVALVLGLTVSLLAGLGAFLAGSWSGWSREAVERLRGIVSSGEHLGFSAQPARVT